LGREEEVKAVRLEEDLDDAGLEETSDGRGQVFEEEEEGHGEGGGEGHEEGVELDDKGWG
jgi:hypothetical protein